MRFLIILILLILSSVETVTAQDRDYNADVETIDGMVEALYATISGEKGEPRQWERFRKLFIPEARLISTGKNQSRELSYSVSSPEEFIENANDYFVQNGFFEYETHRSV